MNTEQVLEALKSENPFPPDGKAAPAQEAAPQLDVVAPLLNKSALQGDDDDLSREPTVCPSVAGTDDNLADILTVENDDFDEHNLLSEVAVECGGLDQDRAARLHKLRCFLAPAGFRGVNARKTTGVAVLSKGYTYPLHAAVRASDCAAVDALIWAGADRGRRDSHKLRPIDLAVKLNRRTASHDLILKLLTV
uniref:Uncharacterized protein n=1 Tax=Zooxanthella nutricula TaxID=1333877 RepID=A0A7S2ITR9_9DINO